MKKLKRSARLVEMTHYLLSRPHEVITLTSFADRYQSAKSSISEDLVIIKEVFELEGIGILQTISGASGGVKYIPLVSDDEARLTVEQLCKQLALPERQLAGGYLYMSDMLGQPTVLTQVGKMFATAFAAEPIDMIMTVETKGIPLAQAVASHMGLPVVIVRRDNKVTEGSVVSINYVSGSTKRIQTMSLARRAMKQGSRVLIIDDFMKAGGTIQGMIDLIQEFDAQLAGIGVFVEATTTGMDQHERDSQRTFQEYISLVRLNEVDMRQKQTTLELGNYFNQIRDKFTREVTSYGEPQFADDSDE